MAAALPCQIILPVSKLPCRVQQSLRCRVNIVICMSNVTIKVRKEDGITSSPYDTCVC